MTKSFYDSKSAGYSFGTDLSKKETEIKIISRNIDQFIAYGFVLRPMWNQTPSIAVQFISLAGFNDGGHDLGWGNVETLLDFDG